MSALDDYTEIVWGKEYRVCELVPIEQPASVPVAPAIPAEVAYTIGKALERYKHRIAEVVAMGWYKDSSPTDNEFARIDVALAWLADHQPRSE
jgi:hypothetical protein